MKNIKKKGFTLVELLVVIAILAILATVSVVGYTSFIARANDSNAETELKQISTLINSALMVDGVYEIGHIEVNAIEKVYCIVDADKVAVDGASGYVLCTAKKDANTGKLSNFTKVDGAKKFAQTADAGDDVEVITFADSEIALDGVLTFAGETVTYERSAGGEATWNLKSNSLVD